MKRFFPAILALLLALPAFSSPTCPEQFAQLQGIHQTTPMKRFFLGEDARGVIYLNARARERYRAFFSEGIFRDRQSGRRLDGEYIYVMDEQGNFFISNHNEVGRFHHSSLLGGQPVAGAGEMKFQDGRLIQIGNSSGHYQPSREVLEQTVAELYRMGVPIDGLEITVFQDVLRRNLITGTVSVGAAGATIYWLATD